MKKEIKYNGCSASPSDYDSQDGELAMSVNLINENGALHPIQQATELFSLSGLNVIKVHEHINTGYEHFIVVYNDNNIVKFNWCEGSQYLLQQTPFLTLGTDESFLSIAGIENTLIISSSKKFYYILWKDGEYRILGNSIPRVDIAFSLDGEVLKHSYPDISVSTSQNNASTSNEEWQGLYSESNISFRNLTHYTYSQYYYLPDSLELDANTDYRVSAFVPGTTPHIKLEGKNQNNEYEVLRNYIYRTKNKENAPKFKTTKAYTDLRICVYSNDYDNMSVSIEIEKGVTQSVLIGRTVEKTQENLDALVGALNHFTKKYATDKERFIHPFFVRYAVRLYDESYAQISAPILMIPNSGYAPLVYLDYYNYSVPDTLELYSFVANLQYALINSISDDWQDIVSGIDFFISEPIYPYNQGVQFDKTDERMFMYKTRLYDVNDFTNIDKGHLRLSHGAYIDESFETKDLYNIIRDTFDFGKYIFDTDENASHDVSAASQHIVVQVSPYTDKEIMNKVASIQNYYLIYSKDFTEILNNTNTFCTMDLEQGVLNHDALVNRMRLEDNLLTYRTPLSGRLYEFNRRLFSFGTSFTLPTPTPFELLNNAHFAVSDYEPSWTMFVYIKTPQGEKVVTTEFYPNALLNSVTHQHRARSYSGNNIPPTIYYPLPWFYYPDSRAYKVQFYDGNDTLMFELSLTRHPYLKGSYWCASSLGFDSSELLFGEQGDTSDNIVVDDKIDEKSNIYVSNVGNPFIFVDGYTVQIGCHNIYALATATKALSQGQFGKFPMYAFTDEGVWAIEVKDEGTLLARQPITRDVCMSAYSITQLDDSVIFCTDRGIMLLSGSTSICLTDVLMSDDLFLPTELTGLTNVCESGVAITPVKFRTFLASCKMLYDYVHQRIIVYNPTKSYAYIYSLKSKLWGMMPCNIKSAINSYPECLALDNNNKVVDFSSVTNSSSVVNGLLVTRPVKLEQDILKTIQSVIQRGEFNFNDSLRSVKPIRTILYGSRDLYNWHLVWSSQDHILRGFSGTPYKYYRIALLCALKPNESVSGCSVLYEPKLTDKLR